MLSFKAFRLLYLIRNCGSCQTDLTIKPCVYVVIPLSQAKLLGLWDFERSFYCYSLIESGFSVSCMWSSSDLISSVVTA